jgi:hypothetical protein
MLGVKRVLKNRIEIEVPGSQDELQLLKLYSLRRTEGIPETVYKSLCFYVVGLVQCHLFLGMDLTARLYFNDFGMAEAQAVSVSLAKRRCSWMAIRSLARHRSRMVVAQAFVDNSWITVSL